MKMIIMGGSAGSLAPLKTVLKGLPDDLDAAVLVLRHSWPSVPSQLARMLAPTSTLPVRDIDDGTPIAAGHVYIAPSGTNVEMDGDGGAGATFRLAEHRPGQKGRPNIDVSMISAAHLFGNDCIGVVLSGYLDDGTEGAIEVGACDGAIIVQAPSDAEQSSMPVNVIERDSPNYILPDIQIAGMLSALVSGRVVVGEDISYAS